MRTTFSALTIGLLTALALAGCSGGGDDGNGGGSSNEPARRDDDKAYHMTFAADNPNDRVNVGSHEDGANWYWLELSMPTGGSSSVDVYKWKLNGAAESGSTLREGDSARISHSSQPVGDGDYIELCLESGDTINPPIKFVDWKSGEEFMVGTSLQPALVLARCA